MGKTTNRPATPTPPVKKRKVYVAFNEEARRNYITGFRKRRQERQEKAHTMLERKLQRKIKEERNKRREKTKEKMNKLLNGINLPGDEEQAGDLGTSETVDFGSHEAVVTVCAGFGDSGLVLAPSEKEEEKSINDNRNNISTNSRNPLSLEAKKKEKEKIKKILE